MRELSSNSEIEPDATLILIVAPPVDSTTSVVTLPAAEVSVRLPVEVLNSESPSITIAFDAVRVIAPAPPVVTSPFTVSVFTPVVSIVMLPLVLDSVVPSA